MVTSFEDSILSHYAMELKNTINDLIQFEKLLKGSLKCKKIYHYTDSYGLTGILQNQLFFATNAAFLSDSTELQYGKEVFLNELRHKLIEENLAIERKEIIHKMIEAIESLNGNDYYLVCFSAHEDDLNQWIKYGDGGKGFCIGFEKNWLDTFFGAYAHILPVVYKKDIQIRVTKQLLEEIFSSNTFLKNPILEYEQIFYKAFANALCRFCLFFKTNSFSSEKEYRVVISKDEILNKGRDVKFRVNANKLIIPYVEARLVNDAEKPKNFVFGINDNTLEKMKKVDVKEILIGPKQDDKAIISLEMFLKQLHYSDIELKHSTVPLV